MKDKIKIKKFLVYLPPGSTVIMTSRSSQWVLKGLVQTVTCDRFLKILLNQVRVTRGRIEHAMLFHKDSCIRCYDKVWNERHFHRFNMPVADISVGHVGDGIVRIFNQAQRFTLICYPVNLGRMNLS